MKTGEIVEINGKKWLVIDGVFTGYSENLQITREMILEASESLVNIMFLTKTWKNLKK